jgi:hypothetical protein
MWQNENGPYMQALYFTFGVGSLLSPLISINFLDDNNDFNTQSSLNNITNKTKSLSNGMTNETQTKLHYLNNIYSDELLHESDRTILNSQIQTNVTNGKISQVYIPYAITGGLLVISALILIVMYIVKKYEPINNNESGIYYF